MNAKFELVAEQTIQRFGRTLFRIRAKIDFGNVKAGDLGGYVEKESNINSSGNAWVSGNAGVSGDAAIFWASKVGSENGTLTVFKSEGGLTVTRGCFIGTPDEFLDAVAKRRGAESKTMIEYSLLIQVAESRIVGEV